MFGSFRVSLYRGRWSEGASSTPREVSVLSLSLHILIQRLQHLQRLHFLSVLLTPIILDLAPAIMG